MACSACMPACLHACTACFKDGDPGPGSGLVLCVLLLLHLRAPSHIIHIGTGLELDDYAARALTCALFGGVRWSWFFNTGACVAARTVLAATTCAAAVHGHAGSGGQPGPAVKAAAGADQHASLNGEPHAACVAAAAGGMQDVHGSGCVEVQCPLHYCTDSDR